MENLATVPMPTPEPEPVPTPVDIPPVPAAPSSSGRKDSSWMWGKGSLDNPRQNGVDRGGVHTSEPMLLNNPQ